MLTKTRRTPDSNSYSSHSLSSVWKGRLSPKMLRAIIGDVDMDRLRDAFIALDSDGDGFLMIAQLSEAVLNALGSYRFESFYPYLVSIFNTADKDGDSRLNLREFLECFAEGLGILPEEVLNNCVDKVQIRMSDAEISVLQRSFFRLDFDGDGLLSHEDLVEGLRMALIRKYPDITDEDLHSYAQYIIISADADFDGKLNLSEYISSFQHNQNILPLELLEYKPEGVLESLSKEEKAALMYSLQPLLEMSQCAAKADKNMISNNKIGENALVLNNVQSDASQLYGTVSELRSLLDELTLSGMRDVLPLDTREGREDRQAIIDAIILGAHSHPINESLITIMPIVRHICLGDEYNYPDLNFTSQSGEEAVPKLAIEPDVGDTEIYYTINESNDVADREVLSGVIRSHNSNLQVAIHSSTGEPSSSTPSINMDVFPYSSGHNGLNSSSTIGNRWINDDTISRNSTEGVTSSSPRAHLRNDATYIKGPNKPDTSIVYEDVSIGKLEKVFRYLDSDHDGFLTTNDIAQYQIDILRRSYPDMCESKAMEIAASIFAQANTASSGWLSLEEFTNSFMSPSKEEAGNGAVLPMAAVDMLASRVVLDLTREEKARLHRILSTLACIAKEEHDGSGGVKPSSIPQSNTTVGMVPLYRLKGMITKEFSSNLPLALSICRFCDPNGTGSVNPYSVARTFNIDIINDPSQTMITNLKCGLDISTETQPVNASTTQKPSHNDNNGVTVSKASCSIPVKDSPPIVTPFEIARMGVCFRQLAPQGMCSIDILKNSLKKIFIPDEGQGTSTHSEMECLQRFHRVVQHIYEVSKKDKNGMMNVLDLSRQFNESVPSCLNLGLDISADTAEKAIQFLCRSGLCNNDLREITATLVDQDRFKDGVVDLTLTYQAITKIVVSYHPTWSVTQSDTPSMLILNSALLNSRGKITINTIIRTLVAEFYVVPTKYEDILSGALSRRLDAYDITKIRSAISKMPQDIPSENIRESLKVAIQNECVVDDFSSVNAIVNTIMEYVKVSKSSLSALYEKLECSPSVLEFPLMPQEDCHDVCLRKLKVYLPIYIIQKITRTLLLLDARGDGLLTRGKVEKALYNELKSNFFFTSIDTSPFANKRSSIQSQNARIVNGTAGALISSSLSIPDDINEAVKEVSRLIILSQYECPDNSIGLSTSASRVLHFNGFINSLIGLPGIIPSQYLPSISIEFRTILSSQEIESLESALDTVRDSRMGIISINDLQFMISNALQENRRHFSHVIIDTFIKLVDEPEGGRLDVFEVVSHFELTQNNLLIHTNKFSPAASERVAGRIIIKDRIRDLARVFIMIDTKKDNVLDMSELKGHLMNDCIKLTGEESTAIGLVNKRYRELDIDHDGVINFEDFLASFCMGCSPALSEGEIINILSKRVMPVGKYSTSPDMSNIINKYKDTKCIEPSKPTLRNHNINANHSSVKNGLLQTSNHISESCSGKNNFFLRKLQNVHLFDSEMHDEFNKYDVKGNGYLDYNEFKEIYQRMENYGLQLSNSDVECIFNLVCASHDRVTFEEFCILMLKRKKL